MAEIVADLGIRWGNGSKHDTVGRLFGFAGIGGNVYNVYRRA